MKRLFYFAYGSNMSTLRLQTRVSSAVPEETGYLYGHRLAFHKVGMRDGSGKCNALETGDTKDYLAGVLFTIDEKHIHLLHAVEGVGAGYEMKQVTVTTHAGGGVRAFTYYATHVKNDLKPFHWYKYHVLSGAREHNLCPEYIDQILSVRSIDDPDNARVLRELSIYDS